MSSKFVTSKPSRSMDLDTPIQFLKGVGPKIAKLFEQKGITTIRDAIYFFPRDYQDRSKIKSIRELKPDEYALVFGKVAGHQFIPVRKLKRPILEASLRDNSGVLSIKWFHYNRSYFETKLRNNPTILAYGQVKAYGSRLQLIHPDIEWDVEQTETHDFENVLPIYSESEGLTQRLLRSVISQALSIGLKNLEDDIPDMLQHQHNLMPIRQAVQSIHHPQKGVSLEDLREFNTLGYKRLIFDELFKFELVIGLKRVRIRREKGLAFSASAAKPLFQEVQARLPFRLTGDQLMAIERIFEDLNDQKPMVRLLQGDVGCGKTLVAFCSCLPIVAGGAQVALMAPTEILAEQHFLNAQKYLPQLQTALLVGSTPKSKREELLAGLREGKVHLLIGTHALIEDDVEFNKLALIIIDEQHRFGVDQRMKLRVKGNNPHFLSLTATPIPRTLALTAYGDLDVSTIKQLPEGRPAIHTKIITKNNREWMLKLVRNELSTGRQAYVIYPLVEESEKIDLANAVAGAEELANEHFSNFKVGLLHGRMKSQEKSQIMESFKAKQIHLLVSTTVVEVGVDVPNATIMVIENAERFGLSQLHQLRGRVGRGVHTSHCFLATSGSSPQAYERLKAMEKTRDGFKLAELDLQIRGPGEFLGTKQSGALQFKVASLVRDQEILQEARNSAFAILKKDPLLESTDHVRLREYMQRAGYLQQKRFETA